MSTSLLLVEDDPGDAGLVRAWLGESVGDDYTIDHVQRLSDVVERTDYQVAILDLGLLESQGLETLTLFRRRLPSCPVVVFTGCDDPALARSVSAAGAVEVVVKDLAGPTVLTNAIARALESGGLAEEAARVRALHVAERFGVLNATLNKLVEGIAVFTSDGRVHFSNAAARALLGIDRRSPLPSPLLNVTGARATATVTSPRGRVQVEIHRDRLPIRLCGLEAFVLRLQREGVERESGSGLSASDELALHGFVQAIIERGRDLLARLLCAPDEPTIAITQRALAADILRLSLQLQVRLVEASSRMREGADA